MWDSWILCPSGIYCPNSPFEENLTRTLLVYRLQNLTASTILVCAAVLTNVARIWHAVFPLMSFIVNDESSRDAEVTAREHLGSSSSLQPREEKQEPVVVRPYPQVQMLSTHHAVASGTPVTVTAPPAHLTPAVPLSFSEGLMKVMARFKISHWTTAEDWLIHSWQFSRSLRLYPRLIGFWFGWFRVLTCQFSSSL